MKELEANIVNRSAGERKICLLTSPVSPVFMTTKKSYVPDTSYQGKFRNHLTKYTSSTG